MNAYYVQEVIWLITSEDEHGFIVTKLMGHFGASNERIIIWLGGIERNWNNGSLVDQGWNWVSEEEIKSFTAWGYDEPHDDPSHDLGVAITWDQSKNQWGQPTNLWKWITLDINQSITVTGYICESKKIHCESN